MQKYTLDEFNQKFGGGTTTPSYTPPKPALPSVFNFGAAKDVFTKAWEDTAMGIAQGKKEGTALGAQTALIQGGLSPFRAIGAGFLGSEQGQALAQGADIGGKLAKAGEYTPDVIKKSLGPVLLEALQGYESKTPEEQLKVRNQLGIAEGLSFGLGGKTVKDVVGTGKNLAGEFATQQAAKGTVEKSATGIREQIRSVVGEGSVDPQFKTSATRVTNNLNYFLEGTGLRVDDAVSTYERYAPLAEKAANDIQQDPPIGIVGEKIGDSFDAVIKQRQDVGKVLGEEVKTIGNLRVEIVGAVKGLLDELQGSGLSYNPRTRQLTSFQGSAFVPEEVDMLSQFIARINLLGQSPSVRDLNNFITRTRSELAFTKGRTGVVGTTNAERIINGGLAKLIDSLNPEVNGIAQLNKYWNARKTYSDLSDFVEEGSGFLGKKTQSGDYAKDASIAKSSVQSILNGGKKDWLMKLEDLTGYNALDDIVLALQAMKDAGDFRGLSLLQTMKDNGIPLTKAGLASVVAENALNLGKRVIAGKPSEQTLAFLKKLREQAKAGKMDLTKADPIVKAKAGTPKNKEIVAIEKKIEANVKAQREALKVGDLTLLQKLKNTYTKLVASLKAEIKKLKDSVVESAKNPTIGMSVKNVGVPKGTTSADLITMREYADMVMDKKQNDMESKEITKSDIENIFTQIKNFQEKNQKYLVQQIPEQRVHTPAIISVTNTYHG